MVTVVAERAVVILHLQDEYTLICHDQGIDLDWVASRRIALQRGIEEPLRRQRLCEGMDAWYLTNVDTCAVEIADSACHVQYLPGHHPAVPKVQNGRRHVKIVADHGRYTAGLRN